MWDTGEKQVIVDRGWDPKIRRPLDSILRELGLEQLVGAHRSYTEKAKSVFSIWKAMLC